MRKPPALTTWVLLAGTTGLAWLATGCGSDSTKPPDPQTGSLVLHLEHQVDTEPLLMDSLAYTNAAGNRYSVTLLRYYLSDVVLRRSDNSTLAAENVMYRDTRDPVTTDHEIEEVPNGTYSSISFTFGLDPGKNMAGGLPTTQENINMEWPPPLGGGYHYMQMEGRFEQEGGGNSAYATHLGSVQLPGDSARSEFYFTVTLPLTPITVSGDTWGVEILMNVNQWYEDPHVYDFKDYVSSIMSNKSAQQILMENGQDAFRLGTVSKE